VRVLPKGAAPPFDFPIHVLVVDAWLLLLCPVPIFVSGSTLSGLSVWEDLFTRGYDFEGFVCGAILVGSLEQRPGGACE
jgi:hypothetical protein